MLYDSYTSDITIKDNLIEIRKLLLYPKIESCNLYGYEEYLRKRCFFDRDYKYYYKIVKFI